MAETGNLHGQRRVGLGWAGLTGLANEDQQFVSIFFLEDLGFSDLGFWA